MTRARTPPPASVETRINVWLNVAAIVVPVIVVSIGGLYALGSFTATIKGEIGDLSKDVDLKLIPLSSKVDAVSQKVDTATKDAQTSVSRVSDKVDSAASLLQSKQDALAKTVENNQAEQMQFRTETRATLGKLFDSQQALRDQVTTETVNRLQDKKK
jgi:hypothetical protein